MQLRGCLLLVIAHPQQLGLFLEVVGCGEVAVQFQGRIEACDVAFLGDVAAVDYVHLTTARESKPVCSPLALRSVSEKDVSATFHHTGLSAVLLASVFFRHFLLCFLFLVALFPDDAFADFVQGLVDKFDEVEMVEDIDDIGDVLADGRYVRRREVGGDGLYVCARLVQLLPESVEGIRSLALPDIHYLSRLQIDHDGLVHMPFLGRKLVDADMLQY